MAPGSDAAAVEAAASITTTHSVALAGETDLDGFRREARRLIAAGVPPVAVEWHVAGAVEGDLFAALAAQDASGNGAALCCPSGSAPSVAADTVDASCAAPSADANVAGFDGRPARSAAPAAFLALCAEVVLHRDPGRFGLLYRLLWRLTHEPALRHDPIDADRVCAAQLAQAVRRDLHKMKAFVRFRPVVRPGARAAAEGDARRDRLRGDRAESDGSDGDTTLHVAWFEPDHHVVEAVAPFFARRFASLRWAILTPDRSVRWDGRRLDFGGGARRDEAPGPDAGEQLWLTYYEHIFNPARLKLAAMQKEMPRKYWPNLPEARLIGPLAAVAHERSARMVAQPASVPRRRIPLFGAGLARRAPMGATVVTGVVSDGAGAAGATGVAGVLPLPSIVRPNALPTEPAERTAALATLRDATARCRECPLHCDAMQAVNGEGPVGAALMLVGEQPGDQEDLRGRPFVGPAGQLLDRGLARLGWPRESLYVSNAVRHFKFVLRGGRRIHKSPSQREADACLHWLESEIALVRPQALVALGATAARQLLGRPVAVLRERGRWHERADGRRVLVTLHPSALLRMPPEARDAAVAQWLDDLRLASPWVGVASGSA